jgi:protein-S-isoprenylcysteine O-methyltransferase Ste14
MDQARHVVAILVLVSYPPAILFWYLLHPFVGFWRRVGPGVTYTLTVTLLALPVWAGWSFRSILLGRDLGTSWTLVGIAGVLMTAGLTVEGRCKKVLKRSTLVGLPEVRGEKGPGLLTQGIYGRVRHPRYVGAVLGLFSLCLFVNFSGVYVLLGVSLAALFGVIRLEERELLARFGPAYEDYMAEVPCILPLRGREP